MRIAVAGIALLAAAAASCGQPAPRDTAPDPGTGTDAVAAAQMVAAAGRLAATGRHLEASWYLEAALTAGGDERAVLPALAIEEVRAGRLRAARESLDRLAVIMPGHPGLEELAGTVLRLTDGRDGAASREVAP
ncbi:MAG: hypothetical protein PHU25_01365 [Deltaproteobacteria bacterium]|nr:hypothetical protein [Deltaproteobacteria bacterium]